MTIGKDVCVEIDSGDEEFDLASLEETAFAGAKAPGGGCGIVVCWRELVPRVVRDIRNLLHFVVVNVLCGVFEVFIYTIGVFVGDMMA